jgi:hypothetical protein
MVPALDTITQVDNFFSFLAQMEESIAEMTTFRQIKAEKAICSDGVSAALQGVPWQGSAWTQSALIYFSFEFWVGGGEGFFHFSFVPNMFHSMFPSGSQYFP